MVRALKRARRLDRGYETTAEQKTIADTPGISRIIKIAAFNSAVASPMPMCRPSGCEARCDRSNGLTPIPGNPA
ncbi:hypothetical protein DTW90_21860 [Neorhizobium sp. P12A]|nr:hypothetical protein DTW90_21860 [Neorhizobium sp. P12A]